MKQQILTWKKNKEKINCQNWLFQTINAGLMLVLCDNTYYVNYNTAVLQCYFDQWVFLFWLDNTFILTSLTSFPNVLLESVHQDET